jgi:hypothetical protein
VASASLGGATAGLGGWGQRASARGVDRPRQVRSAAVHAGRLVVRRRWQVHSAAVHAARLMVRRWRPEAVAHAGPDHWLVEERASAAVLAPKPRHAQLNSATIRGD